MGFRGLGLRVLGLGCWGFRVSGVEGFKRGVGVWG